jgi:hypothetical protein
VLLTGLLFIGDSWTLLYGSGAILTHWVTVKLRDVTGIYDLGFIICAVLTTVSVVLMSRARQKED